MDEKRWVCIAQNPSRLLSVIPSRRLDYCAAGNEGAEGRLDAFPAMTAASSELLILDTCGWTRQRHFETRAKQNILVDPKIRIFEVDTGRKGLTYGKYMKTILSKKEYNEKNCNCNNCGIFIIVSLTLRYYLHISTINL